MVKYDPETSEPSVITRVLIAIERVEGKIDRMDDRVTATEKRVEALLDAVTGSASGPHTGLIVRVHDLESHRMFVDSRLDKHDQFNELVDGRLEDIDDKLSKVLQFQQDHPPLLYLFRFHTRKTLIWIAIILTILLILWTSGALEEILSLFH